ncbi:MAG: nucleotidyltransferase domain-containing protein [Planctomycetes bacterium]|nr:nucleotidyltransferase domain-containing protein [Planctomycetota bacterium]
MEFSYIAVGRRVDAGGRPALPEAIAARDFDDNLKGVTFNENNLEQSATPIWWDGTKLRFDQAPEPASREKKQEPERPQPGLRTRRAPPARSGTGLSLIFSPPLSTRYTESMFARPPARPSLEAVRSAVESRAPRYGLRLAVLFGSAASGSATERSDLDLAVLADGPIDSDGLYGELADGLAYDAVDVVDLFTASPLLAFNALRRCRVLFEDRPGRYRSCACLAARMAADTAWLDKFKDAYIGRVLERLRP